VAGLFGPDPERCQISETERRAAAVLAARNSALTDRGLRESPQRPVESV